MRDTQGKSPPAGGFINAPQQKKDFSLDPPDGLPQGMPSPQTMESFQQLDKARQEVIQKKQEEAEEPDEKEGEAAKESKSNLQSEMEDPNLDFDVFGLDPERRRLLASLVGPEQKALAAKLAGSIRMEHLREFGEFQQWVTVAQKIEEDRGLEVRFRTMSSAEDMMVQEFVAKYEDLPLLTAQTLQQLCILACCVVEVRGVINQQYSSHMAGGVPNEKLFLSKLKMIKQLPVQLSAMMGTHCAWFDERVRERFKLRVEEDLKNG